jgi:DNA-nicking Smr family endonuclease
MARKRALTEDERELFESTLADARPLKKSPRRPKKRTKPVLAQTPPVPAKKEKTEKKETELAVPVLRRRTAGIDGNTADRLRRGLIEPQARLDLHGLSERDAHRALITFVRGARSRKLRMVLIVTGKGGSAVSRAEETTFELGLDISVRGVLRVMTPRWLKEPGLAEIIVDVREAHRRHGGSGALYVYLRKQSPA